MTPEEIVLAVREDFLDDVAVPFLWSDNLLQRYLNLAQEEACRRASLLYDDTTATDQANPALPLCRLTVVSGTSDYVISQKILRILTCVPQGDKRAIEKKTIDWLDDKWPYWRDATGAPIYYLEDKGRIRLVPTPSGDDTVYLSVARTPLAQVTIEGSEALEIPAEYHMQLIDYICELAYMKPDAETLDIPRSDRYAQLFTRNFGPKLSAITEINRRRKPRNKHLRAKEFGF